MTLKGQGATEYLVLLAVVLIVALVSVALLGFFPGISGDAKITQSQAYWSGQATPFKIKDFVYIAYDSVNGACNVIEPTTLYEFIIENAGTERHQIDRIDLAISGLSYTSGGGRICNGAGTVDYGPTLLQGTAFTLSPGEKQYVYADSPDLAGKCSGTAIKTVEVEVNITYTAPGAISKKQVGSKKYIFKCSD